MTWSPTEYEMSEVLRTLSPARFQTYRQVAHDRQHALELYVWNARISSAFFVPVQFCEVAVRNAISDALVLVYGEDWPWNPSFVRSLPQHGHHRENQPSTQLRELRRASDRQQVTGKVIADLKLSFWVHLMTKRYEARLWGTHLHTVFPYLPSQANFSYNRSALHENFEKMRIFRNRIAQHEPIFSRNLAGELRRIFQLLGWRSQVTASWLNHFERVTTLLDGYPIAGQSV